MMNKTEFEGNEYRNLSGDWRVRLAHGCARLLSLTNIKGTLTLGHLVSRCLLPRVTSPVLVRTAYGFDLVVNPSADEGLDRYVYLTGTTERGTLEVMRRCLRAGETVYDVGANIGLMSIFCARVVGESGAVYSFEPLLVIRAVLERNVQINHLGNVEVVGCALGAHPATVQMSVNRLHAGMSSLMSEPGAEAETVRVDTLDNIHRTNNRKRVKLLKIDVEGYELEVLRGGAGLLAREDAPILCVEFDRHRPCHGGNSEDIYPFIKKANDYRVFVLEHGDFRVGKLVETHRGSDLPDFANLFCFLPSHFLQIPLQLFRMP